MGKKSKNSKKKDDFVHLHTHSDMSQLDGAGRIPEYVQEAIKRGNPAIAFTDHGTMRGYMAEYEACKGHDIKPIFGSEFYVSPNMRRKGLTDEERADITKDLKKSEHKAAIKDYEEHIGLRDRWHLNVWAKNNTGLQNLYRLSSAAFIEGFYYKPRIDLRELQKYREGLIVSTGCLSSPIHDNWQQGRSRQALEFADALFDTFGEDLRLELQPHAIRDQRVANKLTLKLHDRYGGKASLLATQDAHYIHQCDAEHHEVLLCIGTGSFMSDPERFKFDGDEFHMRTRKEMFEAFRRHHEFIPKEMVSRALNATMEMAEIVDAKLHIDYHAALLPRPDMPVKYGGDDFAFLRDLCLDGWRWRDIERRSRDIAVRRSVAHADIYGEYANRLKHELKALRKQKFVPYFLIIRELYAHARGVGIMCGPGRGSVGGSLVAYLLGITAVDPIEHGLIFERFINPFRLDMPDIDMDFEDRRRHEIMEWLVKRFGRDKVAQIATVGKLSGKQCLRDVSRVLQVPLNEVNAVTNSIIERSSGDERASQTIEDSFKDFEVCRDFNKRHPKVLHHARRLEGLAKNLGIHAAGVVTSPVPLTDLLPLEIRKHEGTDVIVTALDMYGAAAVGLVKLDVLGLRTLTVIKEALEAIEAEHGTKIDLEAEDFDLNDPKVLQAFTDHDYGGIFQYDTPGADKICAGVKFTDFEDIAAMTALNRPGTARSGLAAKYVERKKNPKLVKKVDFHPLVSEITKDTLGIIVYQEHVIRIFTECAGFAPGTADSLRKTIAKKVGDETIGKERANFIEGCKKHSGMDEKTASKIMDAITFFGCLPKETLVHTPVGAVPVGDLRPGMLVYSRADGGEIVKNRVLGNQDTGRKEVVLVETDRGEVRCSEDHWWQLDSGDYKKAKDLVLGDRLSYVTTYEPKKLKDVLGAVMSRIAVLPRDVPEALPEVVSGAANRSGRPGFQPTQQDLCPREGLESGEVRGYLRGDSIASGENARGRESSLEGRSRSELPRSPRVVDGEREGVRALRVGPGGAPVLDARPSQESKSEGQQVGEFGVALRELPHGGAHRGAVCSPATVKWVRATGERTEMCDIEVAGEPHNYVLVDGFVCHNSYGFNKSHATEYGMIAYWSMWLKVYYPLEFYWSLLKNEPDRLRIAQLAKDAKKHQIQLMAPHVNTSKKAFAMDRGHNAIRGSLVDIKGVGPAAADSIMENQPFADWFDFMARIDRRKVHRGVVAALAKAGAMSGLVPSNKWLIENLDEFWKEQGKKKGRAREMLAEAEGAEDYDEEDMALISSSVNPLAFGKHPIDAYKDFLDRAIKVPMVSMGDEDFFKDRGDKGTFIAGVVLEVKYNQVGDFHTGALPTEAERHRMFWGARYSNVNIEDSGGKQNRCKFDIDIFDEFRTLIDSGVGTPVLAHVVPNERFENLRAQFAVDIGLLRKKLAEGTDLTVWERIVTGQHPALTYDWKSPEVAKKRMSNDGFKKSTSGGVFTGVVTNVKRKYDKNDNEMAFFGLLGADGTFIDVIAFSSVWRYVRGHIKSGRLIRCAVEKKPDRGRGWSYFCGDRVRVLKKTA